MLLKVVHVLVELMPPIFKVQGFKFCPIDGPVFLVDTISRFPLRNFKWETPSWNLCQYLVATYWKKCITVVCYNFVRRVMGRQKMLYMALGKRAILWNRFHRFERVFTSKEIFIEDFTTKNTFFLLGIMQCLNAQ